MVNQNTFLALTVRMLIGSYGIFVHADDQQSVRSFSHLQHRGRRTTKTAANRNCPEFGPCFLYILIRSYRLLEPGSGVDL